MKWKELKEFANSLDEQQLEKEVIVWRESEVVSPISAFKLEADYYMSEDDDEGCYSLDDAGITLDEAQEQELKKVYDKGHPLLSEDF